MSAAEERFSAENGRPPTTEELADELGMSVSRFLTMKRTVHAAQSVSLEAPSERHDESRVGALVPVDHGPSPVEKTERELIREYLTRGLREQDRLIITLYYYERLTMAEIGSVLGVSESRVCQRHAEIVQQLRHRFANQACDLVA